MRRKETFLPATADAVRILGAQIAAARRELGWTAAELAARVGVSAPLISRIENGHPSTQIGAVFEAAVLVGVPLFGDDRSRLSTTAQAARDRLALLPERVRKSPVVVRDDF